MNRKYKRQLLPVKFPETNAREASLKFNKKAKDVGLQFLNIH